MDQSAGFMRVLEYHWITDFLQTLENPTVFIFNEHKSNTKVRKA